MYDEFINEDIGEIVCESEMDVLKDIMSKRNRIAHRGEAVKAETSQKHFELVKKWIAAIDYESGHKWARK